MKKIDYARLNDFDICNTLYELIQKYLKQSTATNGYPIGLGIVKHTDLCFLKNKKAKFYIIVKTKCWDKTHDWVTKQIYPVFLDFRKLPDKLIKAFDNTLNMGNWLECLIEDKQYINEDSIHWNGGQFGAKEWQHF